MEIRNVKRFFGGWLGRDEACISYFFPLLIMENEFVSVVVKVSC